MSWPLGTNDLKQRKRVSNKKELCLVFCEQKQGDPSAPARSSATARSSASARLGPRAWPKTENKDEKICPQA